MSQTAVDYEGIDFFTGNELVNDPYPYFEYLREQNPVLREKHHDVVLITGYDECIEVYRDTDRFSSCIATTGPFPGFPVPLEGDDVSDQIEKYRPQLPFNDQLPTLDPPVHTDHRSVLERLMTPRRLKENEEFMWTLADRQIAELLASEEGEDRCELIHGYAGPFAMLVIADLLGVPEEDRAEFRRALNADARAPGSTVDHSNHGNPLEFLYEKFTHYIEDRRAKPRGDVLTGMASAKFPDGSTPAVNEVVPVAANLFAAGQETTVRLIAGAVQRLAERADLQQRLRKERELIPNFIEEMLRLEGPVKGDFRLARVSSVVGGVDIPAGTTIMLMNGAANRDPRVFENPDELQLDRPNSRKHLAFGYGVHACPGAPLARAETRVSLERLFDQLADIRISASHHGPPEARRYEYAPTYILRGLQALHLEYTLA